MVSLETVERKAIPDTMDVLGLYEVRLDSEGTFLGFEIIRGEDSGNPAEEPKGIDMCGYPAFQILS